MKRIKLFESFNKSIDPIEVRDDIKTILYELEDKGYDVVFKAFVPVSQKSSYIGVDVDHLEPSSPTYSDISYFKIRIEGEKIPKYYADISTLKKDFERFYLLLRDHLDYIDPKNIKLSENIYLYIIIYLR